MAKKKKAAPRKKKAAKKRAASKKRGRASVKSVSTKSAPKPKPLTPRQKKFLKAARATFANGKRMNIAEACRIVRMDDMTHYRVWMESETYAAAWKEVKEEFDLLFKAAVREETARRGIDGVIEEREEKVVEADEEGNPKLKKVTTKKVRRYSDMLLALLNNQLFGDARRMELSGPDGGPIQTEEKGIPIAAFRAVAALGDALREDKAQKEDSE